LDTNASLWLAIDTSTRNCSVALFRADDCLFAHDEHDEQSYNHAERLHTIIHAAMERVQIQFNDLSAILVGDGPGSYTGLRIGVSAAKGYAYAANIPLYALPSLDALYAYWLSNGNNEDHCVAAIDARRMEAYVKVFSNTNAMPTQPLIFDEHTFSNWEGRIAIVGDAASKLAGIWPTTRVATYHTHPSAKHFGALGWDKIKCGAAEDLAYYTPTYGKAFIAGKPKQRPSNSP